MISEHIELPTMLFNDDDYTAVQTLREYYGARYPREGESVTAVYAGAWFDEYGKNSEKPYELTSDDLVAAALLSTVVKTKSVLPLMVELKEQISELLRDIPTDVDLWNVTEEIRPQWSAWKLERLLWKSVPDMGLTRASKLIAHKRPRLYPINDSVVTKVLGTQRSHVKPIHLALQDERLRDKLLQLRDDAHLPDRVSVLRVLDVLAWMDGKKRSL